MEVETTREFCELLGFTPEEFAADLSMELGIPVTVVLV